MRSFFFAFLYFITKSTHMIQLILLMFGLIFPSGNKTNQNDDSKTTGLSGIHSSQGLDIDKDNDGGPGNGGSTGGNTGQNPPPFSTF